MCTIRSFRIYSFSISISYCSFTRCQTTSKQWKICLYSSSVRFVKLNLLAEYLIEWKSKNKDPKQKKSTESVRIHFIYFSLYWPTFVLQFFISNLSLSVFSYFCIYFSFPMNTWVVPKRNWNSNQLKKTHTKKKRKRKHSKKSGQKNTENM